MRADGSEARGRCACPFLPWLASYLLLLSTIQVAVLGWSLASLRLTRPVAAGILVVSVLAARFVRRGLGGAASAAPWAAALDHRSGRAVAGGFAVLYVFLFACAAMVADPSWDGNSYHLPAIQQWFQQGRVAWVAGPESSAVPFMNGYPKGAELISLFLCTLIHPALSNTLNLVYLPLGVLGIAAIARALGATPGAALLAGAALLLVPINLGQSPTTYVDSAFGSAVIAWLAVTVRMRCVDPTRAGLQALVLGCALGQVIGIKGTGLPLGAIGSLALCGAQIGGRSARPQARWLAWWLGVGACALVVGGFWFVRNLAFGHGPLYPIRLSLFGVVLFPGIDPYAPAGAFATDRLIEGWPVPVQVAFTWLQGLWHWPRSIIGFDMRLGGLGFLWPLGCLPAVFAVVRWRIRTRTAPWRDELIGQPLWLLLAIVSAGIVLVPCPWWSRFTLWIYGLGLPCLAVVLGWPMGRAGRAWLAACAVVALVEAGLVVARWQVPLLGIALRDEHGGPPRPAPAVRIPTHFYPPWVLRGTVVERIARGHDTVGIGPLSWYQEPVVGLVSEPVGARRVHFAPEDLEADFADWYERVRPRYVIMNDRPDLPASMSRLRPEVHRVRSLMVVQFR